MNNTSLQGYFSIVFLKVDPNYKVLKDEEYQLLAIDDDHDTGITISNKNNEDGLFSFEVSLYEEHDYNMIYYAIPKLVRNELEKINTVDDILALSSKDSLYHVNDHSQSHYYDVNLEVPIRLKQTKAVDGYKKNNIIYSSYLNIRFNIDQNNNVNDRVITFSTSNNYYGIIQGKEVPSYTKLSDREKFQSTDIQRSCVNTDDQGKVIRENSSLCTKGVYQGSGIFYLVPFFINREGTVTLKITNTVNGLARYNASKDNHLLYKIEAYNTGDASSGNNIITTKVPELVIVDENSISDNGVYNKENNTITWTIPHIVEGERVLVTYEAKAPESAKNKELVGNSTIKSDQVTKEVLSTDTVVTLQRIVEIIKNPETGPAIHFVNTNIAIPVSFLITFVIFISIISFVIVKKYNQKKQKVLEIK